MNSGPGIFELNFNENNGVLAPVAAASTFTVPVELVPYAEACLPADGSLQNLYLNLIPKIDDEMSCCCDRLTAMKTKGDGDCLLHGVMQALCGQEDSDKIFRQLLVPTMTSSRISAELKSLWLASESTEDEAMGFPNAREDFQLVKGYEQCVEEATEPGCFLGPLHVACLANILCRPIVVYADEYVRDDRGEPFSGQSMRGIYLPFLRNPEICHRRCLALVHSAAAKGVAGHFTALIGTAMHAESNTERKFIDIGIFQHSRAGCGKSSRLGECNITEGSLLPLADTEGRLLPLRFCSTSKHGVGSEAHKNELIRRFIDVASLPRAVHTMGRSSGDLDSSGDFILYAIQNSIRISSRIPSVSVVCKGPTYTMAAASARLEEFLFRVERHICDVEEKLKSQLIQMNETKKLVHRMGSSQSSRSREVDLSYNYSWNESKPTEISFDSFARKPSSPAGKPYISPGELYSKHVETDAENFITSQPSAGVRRGMGESVPSPARETYGSRSEITPRERFVTSYASSASRVESAQGRRNVTAGLVPSAAERRQSDNARMMSSPSRPSASRTSLYNYSPPTGSATRGYSTDRISSVTRSQSTGRTRPSSASSSIGDGPYSRNVFDDRCRRMKRQEWI